MFPGTRCRYTDEFETQEEEDEAIAAVEPAIEKLKDAAKRE